MDLFTTVTAVTDAESAAQRIAELDEAIINTQRLLYVAGQTGRGVFRLSRILDAQVDEKRAVQRLARQFD